MKTALFLCENCMFRTYFKFLYSRNFFIISTKSQNSPPLRLHL